MIKKMLLLIMLSVSLAGGSVWALRAQDPPAPQKPSSVRTDPPVAAATTVQTDLSGTYAGTFNCAVAGLTGDTTLTINGNEFTTSDGKTGRIVASTTGGYTAVALNLPGTDPTAAPVVVSLRARKSGNRLTLTSVGGTDTKCTFVPARNMARNRRGQRTPAATGTEVSNPAAMPSAVPTESPMPSQTPAPSPSASPTPSGSPTPSPSPGEPMPSPSPDSSPSPSPSPSPRVQQ
jgi:hypothetical protein